MMTGRGSEDSELAGGPARHIPVLVRQHLEFDMPRMLDILLHVEVAIAEGARRL